MSEEIRNKQYLSYTVDIVAAHVSKNTISVNEIPDLIGQVYQSIAQLGEGQNTQSEPLQPVVPIKKSVTPDYIICLEDGKKLKMLKRHLKTAYDLTPDEYREKWNLPPNYPMVAPNYAKQRSQLAKNIGLGIKNRKSRGGKAK